MQLIMAQDYDDLCHRAADHFVTTVGEAIARAGRASVALSGGSTPRALYRLLAQAPYRERVDWSKLRVFWGDERPVRPDHEDSNYRMAREALLAHVPIPEDQVFRMEAEDPLPEVAAQRYETIVGKEVAGSGIPRFDLIHLGMGDDGHTASLFPHSPALEESGRLVVPNPVAKLGAIRTTFTYPLLNAARNVLFLVSGPGKAEVLRAVLEGPRDVHTYPSQGIRPEPGSLIWLVDRAAAARLEQTART